MAHVLLSPTLRDLTLLRCHSKYASILLIEPLEGNCDLSGTCYDPYQSVPPPPRTTRPEELRLLLLNSDLKRRDNVSMI